MDTKPEIIKALAVAEYFIDKSNKEKKVITNKKLQKLVYYGQAWSLVLRNNQLFNERIEAWVHGPAIRSLYINYKRFGFNPITKYADHQLLGTISTEIKKFLDDVWFVYGNFDPHYLEMLTHSEAPWQEARVGLQNTESSMNEISLSTMKSFYSEKLKGAKN